LAFRKYITFSEIPLRGKEAIVVTFVPDMDKTLAPAEDDGSKE
jgi:hypothetical protein